MKHTGQLTVTSLLSILLLTLHLTQDILYGMAQPGLSTLVVAVPVLVVWLYGTLVLAERRSGYIIILVGSLLGLGVSVIHFRGPSGVLNAEHLKSSGAFFFIWTLLALGVNATYSAVLSVSGLIASARERRLPRAAA
jgi:NO-binding membrane sensor protein with MHYT domain